MIILITSSPSIEVNKTATITDNGDGVTGIGDIINYTIKAQNKGNVTLTGLTITDAKTASGGSLTLSNGPFSQELIKDLQRYNQARRLRHILLFMLSKCSRCWRGFQCCIGNKQVLVIQVMLQIGDDGDDTDGKLLTQQ